MTKKLGQHFLQNKTVVKKIIDAVEPKDGDVIIEIGPGHGELTNHLGMQKSKIKIIAIEKDERLAKFLDEKFKVDSRIEILHGDVLKILPRLVGERKPKIKNYKLVGNIPYYLTGFLFRTISGLPTLPQRTVFMIQKEVALRITATPPRMNLLAASIQMWAKPKIEVVVGKNDFSPKPRVDSAVVSLETRRQTQDGWKQNYFEAIHALFKQPRKTISNNITLGFRSLRRCNGIEKEAVEKYLKQIGVKPNDRPQNLHIEDIKKIGKMLYNYSG